MHRHRTGTSRRQKGLFAACVVAVVAVVAACSPPPDLESRLEERRGEIEREVRVELERIQREATRAWHRWLERRQMRGGTDAPPRPGGEQPAPPPSTTTTTVPPAPEPAPAPPPASAGSRQPLGPGGNWTLRFADEFDGSSLDLSKWRPNWLGGSDSERTPPVNTAELSCYDPAQVRVSGGMLHLTAERLSSPRQGCVLRNGSPAQYASGLVQTNSDYRFTYGYVEARMYLPGPSGHPENWPAFWTNGQSWPRDGEIDVMEVLGGEPRWHFHHSGGSQGSKFDLVTPKAGWHTFGALWEPGRITFYYDGREVGSTTQGVTSSPHYIILNHALSSSISGPVVTPSTLRVDYVRHWQR